MNEKLKIYKLGHLTTLDAFSNTSYYYAVVWNQVSFKPSTILHSKIEVCVTQLITFITKVQFCTKIEHQILDSH